MINGAVNHNDTNALGVVDDGSEAYNEDSNDWTQAQDFDIGSGLSNDDATPENYNSTFYPSFRMGNPGLYFQGVMTENGAGWSTLTWNAAWNN